MMEEEPSVPMPDALDMVRKAIDEIEPQANKMLEEAYELANGGFNADAMEKIRERELGKEKTNGVTTDFGSSAPILRSELLMYVIMLLQQIETVTMSLNYLTLKNQEALLLQGMQGNASVDRIAALEQKISN